MERVKEIWENFIIYAKEHKPIMIIAGIFIVILIILILLISLTSNSSVPEIPPTPIPDTTSTPTPDETTEDIDDIDITGEDKKITIWGAFIPESAIQPLIDDYLDLNEEIEIEYTQEIIENNEINDYKTRLEDVLSDEQNEFSPDIFIINNGWSGKFKEIAAKAPSDIMTLSEMENDYYEFVVQDFSDGEDVYGLPLWVDTLAVIYNEKMWTDAGLTEPDSDWNTFVDEQLPKLFSEDDTEKAAISAGDPQNNEFWFETINTLLFQNQIEMISDGTAIFADNPDTEGALKFYNTITENSNWSEKFNQDIAAFLEGKLATYIAPSWRLNQLIRYNKLSSKVNLDIGVKEMPQLQLSETKHANFAMYWGFMVNSQNNSTNQAWDFLKFISEEQNIETINDNLVDNQYVFLDMLYPQKKMSQKQLNEKYLNAYVNSLDSVKTWNMYDKEEIKQVFEEFAQGSSSASSVQENVNAIISKNSSNP